MKKLYAAVIGSVLIAGMAPSCFGQDGTDINQAIPIYFGQTINDSLDSTTRPVQVYSIVLAKGQSITATVKTTNGQNPVWTFLLGAPSLLTVSGFNCANYVAVGVCGGAAPTATISYHVAAAGTYYIVLNVLKNPAYGNSPSYQLQVTAQGTPIATPNPPQAGCLTGQIDYITYSLQLIAAGLPDTASIGGSQMCASCTVKPPAYPALASKMETAMGLNTGVSACYDSAGNIFQLKLIHP